MAKDVSDIPDSLKDALKAGRVIPFVGAGVSRSIEKKDKDSAKPFNPLFPSWKEFLVSASKKLRGEKDFPKAKDVIKLINLSEPDYLKSAEVAKNSLKTKLWNDLLNESFKVNEDKADLNTLKYPQAVWKLGSNLIYTTNIDNVLEWKSVIDRRVERLDVQIDEFAELQQNESIESPTVVYLHGHISSKSSIVFTKTQYEDFYDKLNNEAKLQALRTFLTNHTFLFLGFSLDDPYFLRQLDYVHKIYNGAASSFYILIPEWEKDNKNIPDFVKIITFSNFRESLFEKIDELIKYAKSNDDKSKTISDDVKTQPPDVVKKDAQEAFFNVPYRSKGDEFVGRKGKKEEIWNALNKSGCASIGQAVSVKGFGGLGKTQLAVEFADAYKDRYKNGVYWLVADTNIENQIVQIADERKWINKDDKSINQTEVAKERFKQLSDCLILVDNVETFDDVKDYLPKTDSHTHLLITSREKDGRFHEIDIDLLERDESRKFLQKVSNRNPSDENEKAELEKILEILGGIPLAIELVGGYLAEHMNVSFAKYHKFLEEYPLDTLEKEFPDGSFTNHDRSIIQTLRISEKTIEKKPLMYEILKVLAWSGSSSMGVLLLQTMVGEDNEFAFETAIGDALRLRLIKEDETGERYTIHRLLAKVIRYEQQLETQNDWTIKIVNRLETWFDSRKNKFEKLPEFESEIEHLQEWQSELLNKFPSQTILLMSLQANSFWLRGNYKKALNYQIEALELYTKENLKNKRILAVLYNTISYLNWELDNFKDACKYGEKALVLFDDEEFIDDSLLGKILNDVGLGYNGLGINSKALEFHSRALEIRQKLHGDNRAEIAISLNNLGTVYNDLKDYGNALKYYQQSLELRKSLFGETHPDIANCYNNIATLYANLRKYDDALNYYNLAFEIYEKLLYNHHPDTITVVGNLIDTYQKLGRKETAGKKANLYLKYIPQNHPNRKWFEDISRPYRPKKNRHKNKKRR